MSKNIIKYSDLVIGMRVQDKKSNVGIVKEFMNIHNIFVEYINGGSGFHCLVDGCMETTIINGEEFEVPHYEPLFYI